VISKSYGSGQSGTTIIDTTSGPVTYAGGAPAAGAAPTGIIDTTSGAVSFTGDGYATLPNGELFDPKSGQAFFKL
jgi:hypothetical protein